MKKFVIPTVFTLLLLVACGGDDPTPTVSPAVAETPAPAVEEQVAEPEQSTAQATEAPSPSQETAVEAASTNGTGEDLDLDPEQITLDSQLPYVWEVVPPTAYDDSQPPGAQGLPSHVKIWVGVDDPSQAQDSTPLMYIIPVEAYSQQWEQNGNDSVSMMIDGIYQYTIELPEPPSTSGVPVLPFEEISGVQDFATQLDRAGRTSSSASKNGYRFVGRFAQDMSPVTSDGLPLQYMYQGFTNDGRFLVAYFQEVTSEALPTNAEVADQFSQATSQSGGYDAYLQGQAVRLDGLEGSEWQPDLTQLDDLIGSLTISTMPKSGIEGRVWMMTAQATADGTVQAVGGTIDYTIIFSEGGSYTYQADCNSGGGQYAVTGGMVGGLAVEAGPTTFAECGPNSDYDVLVSGLLAAQEYRVHPGGNELELVLPSGGGSLFFANLGSGEAVDPDAPETTLPPPESDQPTGVVVAPSGVNVRIGPGTQYATIGFAPYGTEGAIVGVSADGEWYASPNPDGSGTVGWVTSAYVEVTNPENVPVILPGVPTPTPIPTALPPAEPQISFWADDTTIERGECTNLHWDVENIQAVWVYPQGEPYQEYPTTGQGSQTVCPVTTTTYEMRVLHRDGTVELYQVTIYVEESVTNPLANSSWILASMFGNQATLPATTLTLSFGEASVSGDGGCNSFNGPYVVDGSSISIGPLSSSRSTCGTEIDTQEQAYLAALQSAATYQLSGGQLILRDASGAELLRYN